MDLFAQSNTRQMEQSAPLAVRMRPCDLSEVCGQQDLVGPGKPLRTMVEHDSVSSMILYGPPGTGKTTLARIVARKTQAQFEQLNAVTAGVGDIRKLAKEAQERAAYYGQRTIVFVDEIHRFNKGQQDALLPFVEQGTIILIGATTENPYFEVNSPLISRCRVFVLHSLSDKDIADIVQRALRDCDRGLGNQHIEITEQALQQLVLLAGGDARSSLNLLELTAQIVREDNGSKTITLDVLEQSVQHKALRYDKSGDNHYDTASAFIKSMRGSDPDAALHYLARMLCAGEDVKFIARRMVICASEDVGNADPQALILANSAAQAVQFIGMPEARIILAQAVVYIATAPKSNSSYLAIDAAMQDVRNKPLGAIPPHLRDSHYRGAEKLGHGQGYRYPHNFDDHYVSQQYLPDNLAGQHYYITTSQGFEQEVKRRMQDKR